MLFEFEEIKDIEKIGQKFTMKATPLKIRVFNTTKLLRATPTKNGHACSKVRYNVYL